MSENEEKEQIEINTSKEPDSNPKGVLQPTGYMQIPTMRIDFDGEKVIYDFSEQGKEKESELPTRANAENSLATIGG